MRPGRALLTVPNPQFQDSGEGIELLCVATSKSGARAMVRPALFAACLLGVGFAGCAPPGRVVTEAQFRQLKKGMTPQEVTGIFGPPAINVTQEEDEEEFAKQASHFTLARPGPNSRIMVWGTEPKKTVRVVFSKTGGAYAWKSPYAAGPRDGQPAPSP